MLFIMRDVSRACQGLRGSKSGVYYIIYNVKLYVRFYSTFYVHINVEFYFIITEKKCITEYLHGYVYITKHRYVILRSCLLFEILVEQKKCFVEELS